jgi:hypothetical protein
VNPILAKRKSFSFDAMVKLEPRLAELYAKAASVTPDRELRVKSPSQAAWRQS